MSATYKFTGLEIIIPPVIVEFDTKDPLLPNCQEANSNGLLETRRPSEKVCMGRCIFDRKNGKSIDHIFLLCPVAFELWQHLFFDWVPVAAAHPPPPGHRLSSFRGLTGVLGVGPFSISFCLQPCANLDWEEQLDL